MSRRSAPSIALLVLGLSAVAAGSAAAGNVPAGLVLSKGDVGRAYALNRPITRSWTLGERSAGLSRQVRNELAAKWVAGRQIGFNGTASVSNQAILSTADVFRTSAVSGIVRSWRNVYLRNGRGTPLPVPVNAPGSSRFLMRGQMGSNGAKLEVILYLWQHDKAVLSVWLIAKPGVPRLPNLMRLARIQDAKVTASLG